MNKYHHNDIPNVKQLVKHKEVMVIPRNKGSVTVTSTGLPHSGLPHQ
jgi:hypothetical protein